MAERAARDSHRSSRVWPKGFKDCSIGSLAESSVEAIEVRYQCRKPLRTSIAGITGKNVSIM